MGMAAAPKRSEHACVAAIGRQAPKSRDQPGAPSLACQRSEPAQLAAARLASPRRHSSLRTRPGQTGHARQCDRSARGAICLTLRQRKSPVPLNARATCRRDARWRTSAVMRLRLCAAAALLLTLGCGASYDVVGPQTYSIVCSHGRGHCYEKAIELCPNGFTVVGGNERIRSMYHISEGPDAQVVPLRGEATIRCGAMQPAPAPCSSGELQYSAPPPARAVGGNGYDL